MKHLTKLRDYLHRNPMWKTCNIDLYQNGFQMYFGPEAKDIISKSYTDYINGKGDKYTEEDRKRCFTDLNFVLEDFPFQCRGLCVWQTKKYKPGRTHYIFVFTDNIPIDKELFGTAIHELQHVVDYIFIQHKLERSMGPGPSEISAYIMQYLMRRMFAWFENLLLNVIPNEVVTDEDKGVIKAGDEQAVVASPHSIEVYGQTKTFVTKGSRKPKPTIDRWNAALLRQRLHMAIDTQPLGLRDLYKDKTIVSQWLEDAQLDADSLHDMLAVAPDEAFKKIDLVESDRFTAYEFTVPGGIALQRDVVGITELADDDMIELSLLHCSDKVRWVCCMKETQTHLTTNKITFVIDKWTDENKTVFHPHIVRIQCGDYIQATHVDEDVINRDDRYRKFADTPMPVAWVRESTLLPDETYVLIEKCKMTPNGGIERSS